MAANMKAVKLRIKSVQSTMQITKAMELVASSKLRKAKERSEKSRPYFKELYETLVTIAKGNTDFSSVYARTNDNAKICYVILGGDRGLAGGYNSNIFKKFEAEAAGKDYTVLPVGKKVVDYCRYHGKDILSAEFAEIADIDVADCFDIAKLLCNEFKKGTFGSIRIFYTEFVSMLAQTAHSAVLLPLSELNEGDEDKTPIRNLILYEPDSTEVFDAIVPEYLAGVIYGAVCDSLASELAARRTAMDAATSNAEEMIGKLSLSYNRARQASITQEITEIVGGAEGLK